MGGAEVAGMGLGTGKRPADMAKELTFGQRLGDRGAVDGDKRSFLSRQGMERLGRDLFAGAAVAQQQHGTQGRRPQCDLMPKVADGGTLPDE